MSRLSLMLAAVCIAASAVGCTHCDTCNDFPLPCNGPNCGYNTVPTTMAAPDGPIYEAGPAPATAVPAVVSEGPVESVVAPPTGSGPFTTTPSQPNPNPAAGASSRGTSDTPPAAPGTDGPSANPTSGE